MSKKLTNGKLVTHTFDRVKAATIKRNEAAKALQAAMREHETAVLESLAATSAATLDTLNAANFTA